MQNRGYSKNQELVNIATVLSAVFSFANATSICTSNGHGFRDGDVVRISSETTLPDGLLDTVNYFVKVINANTFYLYLDSEFKTLATATDDGTGDHTFVLQSRKMNVKDYKVVVISLSTTGDANFTMKCQGSSKDEAPEFADAASATNPWSYVQMVNLDDGDTIDGNVGTGPIGTDINTQYEVNTNALSWICFDFTTVTTGKAQMVASGFDNN